MTAQDLRTALAAGLATLLGAGALRPVYATGRWFPPVLAAVLVVFAGGLLLRTAGPALWARVARGRPVPDRVAGLGVIAVPLGQAALLACLFSALYAPSSSLFGFLPTSESLADVAAVLTDGAAEVQEQAPPALPLTGLVALTTLLVGDRRDRRRPHRGRRAAGRASPGWGCWSSTACRSARSAAASG